MSSNVRAPRATVADIVEGLLTAPQPAIERAAVVWGTLRACRDSKADFSDALIVELGPEAGCTNTLTFEMHVAAHLGFEAMR